VTEDNWLEGARKDRHFAASETPRYIGRAVAALAADPNVNRWAGHALATWQLTHEYGFIDIDGRRPDWGAHIAEHLARKDGER
jgi:hypothetical protein